jgi:hypothetical protein
VDLEKCKVYAVHHFGQAGGRARNGGYCPKPHVQPGDVWRNDKDVYLCWMHEPCGCGGAGGLRPVIVKIGCCSTSSKKKNICEV